MIPKASEGLGHVSMRIAVDLIPRAADDYAATDMGYIALLLTMVGQDFDRFADVHVCEHEQMTAIFRNASIPITDENLRRRIAAALAMTLPSLKARDLNARADISTRLLIDLHAAVEIAMDHSEPWAGSLNDQIWTFLDGYAERRAYVVPF